MTTTDLMIGNWVLDTRTNNPLQVNPFMAQLEVPEWKEIELTRDILIKNEFSRIYCSQCFTYHDWYGHCIMVNLDNLNLLIKHDYKILYNVTFNKFIPVHFLQNAIKITGVNKKNSFMKKIMFNDKYGLTKAVLEGQKTMTRRAVPMHDYKYGFQVWYDRETKQCCVCDGSFIVERSRYARGEVVAIAQSYRDVYLNSGSIYKIGLLGRTAGWRNKMYVSADDMPHHIKITNIRVEHLQDISDYDCLREGIYELRETHGKPSAFSFIGDNAYCGKRKTPREAFAALIDKVSGKGTWESNPLVWVYEFELINSKK